MGGVEGGAGGGGRDEGQEAWEGTESVRTKEVVRWARALRALT